MAPGAPAGQDPPRGRGAGEEQLRGILYQRIASPSAGRGADDGRSNNERMRAQLKLLDQRKLPHEKTYLDVKGTEDAWRMIRDMVVRGAPAIAISGALSLAIELQEADLPESAGETFNWIKHKLEYLVTSRPTAVNLSIAAQELVQVAANSRDCPESTPQTVADAVIAAAEKMLQTDTDGNLAMGDYGSKAIQEAVQAKRSKQGNLRVLTHCNTGALATASFGTALGVIRALHNDKVLDRAYCTETRPYNQGARLTAFELVHDNIPSTLICDSSAAALMSKGGVDAVVVGADRIAANGDVANKIGTLSLAVAAAHAGVPFFVAAPLSTVDLALKSGDGIPIEERSAHEVTHLPNGDRAVVDGIGVWNPAFDVTPAKLIAGIITERGTVWPDPQTATFDMSAFAQGSTPLPFGGSAVKAFTEDTLREYITKDPELSSMVGGDSSTWTIREVGDGNINFVFIIEGTKGGIVAKQALPYVRCIGESFPLPTNRIDFETGALIAEHAMCPEHVPKVYKFDDDCSTMVMEYLAPPNIILRYGLIEGVTYPHLAESMSTFLANTLFKSSLLNMTTSEYRLNLAKYTKNSAMCELTEQVIFTDPYGPAEMNRWNQPYMDAEVEDLWRDVAAKQAISELKRKFCEHGQALIHGDLHSGSVMITQQSMHVIDPEFAFYGPMGFDIGAFVANLFLAYFASEGHEKVAGDRDEHRAWLLACTRNIWNLFQNKFLKLWNHNKDSAAYPQAMFGQDGLSEGDSPLVICQESFMRQLFEDSIGFAGAKMIRRIVGVAHVADMDNIEDAERRAVCEKRALRFGRHLLVGRSSFEAIEEVVKAATTFGTTA